MSHQPGKMKSVPKGAHNKRTRAVRDGGLRQQRVWLVMAIGGVRRGGEHNNQPKEGRAGSRVQGTKAQRTATAVRAMAAATAEVRAVAAVYAAVRAEATVAAVTLTTTTTTAAMTAAETSLEAAVMMTVEVMAMAAAMTAAHSMATAATMAMAAVMTTARDGCVEGNFSAMQQRRQ